MLEGRGRWFSVRDVITFESLGDDLTRIHYVAEFTFRKGLQRLATRLEPGFKKMGRASLRGLASALADDNPPPEASRDTQKETVSSQQRSPASLAMATAGGRKTGDP